MSHLIFVISSSVTPPSAVGYANGIAQSIVSLARCLGPSLGGYVSTVSDLFDYHLLRIVFIRFGQ